MLKSLIKTQISTTFLKIKCVKINNMPKGKILVTSLFAFIFFAFIFTVISYNLFLSRPIKEDYSFEIPLGTSKSKFIQKFKQDQNLGPFSATYLKVYYFINKSTPFEAGVYQFDKGTSIEEVVANIKGGVLETPVTFLEGWRVEQNSLALASAFGEDFAKDYYNLAKDKIGYLFPDTYFIAKTTTPQQLISTQEERFNTQVQPLISGYKGQLSKKEVIIMASIVEREALSTDDKNIIAGILIKRYLQGWPLDADATTQYGVANSNSFPACLDINLCDSVEFWPKNLSKTQLKSNNPYNTRGVLGLPPTPISNPSLSSIKAVVNPKESPYYFYLHDISGNTYFAVTDKEHVANIQKFL